LVAMMSQDFARRRIHHRKVIPLLELELFSIYMYIVCILYDLVIHHLRRNDVVKRRKRRQNRSLDIDHPPGGQHPAPFLGNFDQTAPAAYGVNPRRFS
jgi:hypothetical protein